MGRSELAQRLQQDPRCTTSKDAPAAGPTRPCPYNRDSSHWNAAMKPPVPVAEDPRALAALNGWLAMQTAEARVEWAVASLPGGHALSTSFGAQSAVALHLSTRLQPDLPIILVDTGYLFPETYRFADELVARLKLNLKVEQPELSPARMEARHGQLWEQGINGLDLYNRMRKVEPMKRALDALGVRTWIAGIRRSQSTSRANIEFLELRDG